MVSITVSYAGFENFCGILLSIKSCGERFLLTHKTEIMEMLQSLTISLESSSIADLPRAICLRELSNVTLSLGGNLSTICTSSDSLDRSVCSLLSCLESESNATSYSSKLKSCESSVLYEIRRIGILKSILKIDQTFHRVCSAPASSSFMDICGFSNFDKYLQVSISVICTNLYT